MRKFMYICCYLSFYFPYATESQSFSYSGNGETRDDWKRMAKADIDIAINLKPTIAVAKNVIMFLGDGMGVSTVTAGRILKGQNRNKTGEETVLSFDKFPHVALSKTYNQDAQTPDSAATATAFLCGVKANLGTIGLDGRARRNNCTSAGQDTHVTSILDWSLAEGKSVGIVTNTRVTHATPAALYAHVPERDWEGDSKLQPTVGCRDIALQLIDDNIDIHVIMGGGRKFFLKENDTDPEESRLNGTRKDNRNLIATWQKQQQEKGRKFKFITNSSQLKSLNSDQTDYLLGLFAYDHMAYEIDRNDNEPSLAEMTDKAIRILRKNPKGYFLLVEGGRIDHGHHDSKAAKALHDLVAFDDAVAKGAELTNEQDTLIVTTADHSHVFSIAGYPTRGNPIFGLVDDRSGGFLLAKDNKTFTTLVYGNGPGHNIGHSRQNLTNVDTIENKEYISQSAVPLDSETHGGEDVAIFARGPMSHLFHGVHEQHYIAHVMAYASCVGDYRADKDCAKSQVKPSNINGSSVVKISFVLLAMIGLLITV
ncbi:hypothetical protein CHS0354_030359 [Potamilus streckersoni]|uniref:Alkaline phosphatase, tissue-nonspecific isozyme n=1 Tax=Potamilus streckersoni TaxID=2493646 RepID=A0AAE0T4M6_9BIVA|nr:hypothetical protein CHS0354_030359 [Potamilus streckersoni]